MTQASDIELVGVTKRFGPNLVAVDAIDLTIPAGTYCCLLGPVRLRQDHDPAHDRRPRGADRGRDPDRRRRRGRACRRCAAAPP